MEKNIDNTNPPSNDTSNKADTSETNEIKNSNVNAEVPETEDKKDEKPNTDIVKEDKKEKKSKPDIEIGVGSVLLGLAGVALGIGGKLLFDSFTQSNNNDKQDNSISESEKKIQEEVKPIISSIYDNIQTEESAYICPLSHMMMNDPIITPYGISFDRSAIEAHLSTSSTCPLTNKPLSKSDLIPNYALKSSITEYLKRKAMKH